MIDRSDRRRCSNEECPIRTSCARASDSDFDQVESRFPGGEQCSAFVLRRALGRDNPDMVFTEGRRRGRRHNAHAYMGPRKEYPGVEALFGAKLATALRRGSRADNRPNPVARPKRPDLLVTRHIRDGRNIKQEENE